MWCLNISIPDICPLSYFDRINLFHIGYVMAEILLIKVSVTVLFCSVYVFSSVVALKIKEMLPKIEHAPMLHPFEFGSRR